ncbi:hypothetical protein MXB_499 [Myxobolus squamalis]|nr:hypothetical protein MXB_499 [Myxobolus squamalis]
MTNIEGIDKLVQIHCAKCSKKFNNRQYCPVCLEVHWNPGKFRYCSTCIKCKMTIHEGIKVTFKAECMQQKTKMCMVCSGLVAKRF